MVAAWLRLVPSSAVGTLRGVQYLMPECQTLRVTRRATEGGGRVRDFVQQSRAGAESTEPNMCAGVARPLTITFPSGAILA